MSKYKDIDVPFCLHCTRFMVKNKGLVQVALNHFADESLTVRYGQAFKCPECGRSVISRWVGVAENVSKKDFLEQRKWVVFLEDHKTCNRGRAIKSDRPE